MNHTAVRAAAAAACFTAGVAAVWLLALLAPLEAALAEWLVPTSGISVPAAPLPGREEADTEAVYAAALRGLFGGDEAGRLLVIQTELTGCATCSETQVHSFPGAARETLADFNGKAEARGRLSPFPGVRARQVLLDAEDYMMLFRGCHGGGWEQFYERYPGSTGYITLSSVGFNRAGDEAFLYAGRFCGRMCGEGRHVLLRKGPGGWLVVGGKALWVS